MKNLLLKSFVNFLVTIFLVISLFIGANFISLKRDFYLPVKIINGKIVTDITSENISFFKDKNEDRSVWIGEDKVKITDFLVIKRGSRYEAEMTVTNHLSTTKKYLNFSLKPKSLLECFWDIFPFKRWFWKDI